MATGLDIGTGTLQSAHYTGDEQIRFQGMRNMFCEAAKTPMVLSMLKKSGAPYVEMDGKLLILGDQALQLAASFAKEVRRPMAAGVINAGEIQALPIIREMIRTLTSHQQNGVVCYSVPADPVDASFNAVYHEGVFNKLLQDLGYTPVKLNEGMAAIYGGLLEHNLSGFGFSFGAGMCNVACSVMGQEVFSFSVARSGDYIDENVAKALGISRVKAMRLKEAVEDINAPTTQEEQAVLFYYQNMISYVLSHVADRINGLKVLPDFEEPPAVIITGGTSSIPGFGQLFEKALRQLELPLKFGQIVIPEISPLHVVAQGCLANAVSYED